MKRLKNLCLLLSLLMACTTTMVHAEDDFADMDLDALMNVEVSSVTKGKGMKLSDAPGAITVISEEDIRRTGHQSIPELLRLVPGLHVGRMDANNWAISARGFNTQYNKYMLVMMDGRSIYTPLFSGVFWDTQDTVMEDIKSIEVIRGPGGTLWGANAVNGVINITTKDAKDTQGLLFSSSVGTEDLTNTSVRYGGKINDNSHFRVYGKFQMFDDLQNASGADNDDEYKRVQTGFRVDTQTDSNHLTVQGDWNYADMDTITTYTSSGPNNGTNVFRGGNLLARLTHEFSDDSNIQFQFYFDHVFREDEALNDNEANSLDFDMQHSFVPTEGHNLIWGLNYHWRRDTIVPFPDVNSFDFIPRAKTDNTVSAFIQDSMTVVPEKLFFTIGTKIEHNDYTGVEIQPSTRLSWRVKDGQTFWGAISRAVRTPSRLETGLAMFGTVFGNPGLEATNVMAYEAGYRISLNKHLSLDMATYFNKYENLSAVNFGQANDENAEAYGFEASATWQVAENLKIIGNYTFQDVEAHGGQSASQEGTTPRNHFNVRAYYDLNDQFEVNTALYWYDNVPGQNTSSYFRYDLGMTWKPKDNLELSVWGQNLTDDQHPEYGTAVEVETGVYGKITMTF
ncbi:MAG TPA: hypothetical protein DER01_22315 [Phycisphaerales bacterium]|nr:hypothetical protein [Phycisphaerales bacterium]|tara:strand:+ start:5149 stop:7017 length:1869 start_codon:yes stop_codon:yes gene_type:complete